MVMPLLFETATEALGASNRKAARQLEVEFNKPLCKRSFGRTDCEVEGEKRCSMADRLLLRPRKASPHVNFGQSARSRWDILLHGSVLKPAF